MLQIHWVNGLIGVIEDFEAAVEEDNSAEINSTSVINIASKAGKVLEACNRYKDDIQQYDHLVHFFKLVVSPKSFGNTTKE